MDSPLPTVTIVAVYLYIVLVLGPRLMANRKPFQLNAVLVAYNALQVVFSILMLWEVRRSKQPAVRTHALNELHTQLGYDAASQRQRLAKFRDNTVASSHFDANMSSRNGGNCLPSAAATYRRRTNAQLSVFQMSCSVYTTNTWRLNSRSVQIATDRLTGTDVELKLTYEQSENGQY